MKGQHPILRIFGGLYLLVFFTQPAAAGEIVGRVFWQPGAVPAAGSFVEARTVSRLAMGTASTGWSSLPVPGGC